MIDCGEGTQRQILQSGLGFKHLNKILITHSHLDHILGLAGLVSTYMRWEAIDQLDIYAGKASLERIHDLLYSVVLRNATPPITINMHQISSGTIFEGDDFSISAFPVSHRGPDCFGFKFVENGHAPFLAEKADEMGIPAGPMRRDLVKGIPVTLVDGRIIEPSQVLGEFLPGVTMVHIGDVGVTEPLVEICKDF